MNPLRVLVVDDDDAMRNVLNRLLTARNFDVTTVASGTDALSIAAPGKFDLIILDLWMPGMNGLETLTRLRKTDPWVPVIAVSAMGTDATIEACRSAGATAFLPKPFTAEDIENLAREARSGRIEQNGIAAGAGKGWRGRVLVADDHDAYRTAIARRLRLDGFDVDEVASGAEVAIASEGAAYDALLLDIHMPGGNGLFAAETVRTRDPFLPILFMTGEATEGEVRRGFSSSTAGCLRKPIEMDRLGRMLEFLISAGKKSRERARSKSNYDALPETKKAAIAIGARARQIRRSPETTRVAVGVVIAVLLALGIMTFLDAGQRAFHQIEKSLDDVPGPIQMYRTIAGYLERDEQRELEQGKNGR